MRVENKEHFSPLEDKLITTPAVPITLSGSMCFRIYKLTQASNHTTPVVTVDTPNVFFCHAPNICRG